MTVHHLTNQLHRHILGKYIAVALYFRAVAYPGNPSDLLIRIAVVNFVDFPQLRQNRPVVHRRHLGQAIFGKRLGIGQLVFRQPACKCLAVGVGSQSVGLRLSQRQQIPPCHTLSLTQLNQPKNGRIAGAVVLFKGLVRKFQCISQPVGYQHLAVAIRKDAPAGLHGLRGGIAGHGLGPILAAVYHLILEQQHAVKNQYQRQKSGNYQKPPPVGVVCFHRFLLSEGSQGNEQGRGNTPSLRPSFLPEHFPNPGKWHIGQQQERGRNQQLLAHQQGARLEYRAG